VGGARAGARSSRNEALTALAFPHPAFRTGQRELAEAVYKGAATGRCVMAQAPTGIGKTVGTVFAMLKAGQAAKPGQGVLPDGQVDRAGVSRWMQRR
jgi:Rad3-related DNA helicase